MKEYILYIYICIYDVSAHHHFHGSHVLSAHYSLSIKEEETGKKSSGKREYGRAKEQKIKHITYTKRFVKYMDARAFMAVSDAKIYWTYNGNGLLNLATDCDR